MLEAVGLEYLEAFFVTCDRLLHPGGSMTIQTIAVAEKALAAQRHGVNWIQRRVFPGSALPSLEAIERAVARTALRVRDVDDIGPQYPETLRRWRAQYLSRQREVRALGFNQWFARTWLYYLASCEASFRAKNTMDLQIVLEKVA
jgi:cyclopropane-fatty-acyl-phospholipid synthase